MKQLIKKLDIHTALHLISGLHIGGNGDNVEIGGIDNPVIRNSIDRKPYIPGSSLKGKMRCLLEQIYGSPKVGGNEKINNLFGFSGDNKPSKIIVRDAFLTEESVKELKDRQDNLDAPFTEGKWENVIDRIKGTAEHPRQTERVPAGVSFDVEFILNIWDDDDEQEMLGLLKEGIKALENDYLGGSGSRGYGQVKFDELKQEEIKFNSARN